MKRKTCDNRTWAKLLFSTYHPLISIHLSHRFTRASKPAAEEFLTVVSATSAPQFRHLRLSNDLEKIYRTSCESFYTTDTSHRKQEICLYEYPFNWVLLPTNKRTTERCSSVGYSSSTVAIFTTETSLWTCACASTTYTVMKLDCAAT
jgi:hypothetical protein